MNIQRYNLNDLTMYLNGVYCQYRDDVVTIRGVEIRDSEGNNVEVLDEDGEVIIYIKYTNGKYSDFRVTYKEKIIPIYPPALGFFSVENTVVYLANKQGRNYKRFPTTNTIEVFTPQKIELEYLGKELDFYLANLLLVPQTTFSLSEAYTKLQDGELAVILHSKYALVKKSTHEHPVVYYTSEPVLTYDGEHLTPINDSCHLTKFRSEVAM